MFTTAKVAVATRHNEGISVEPPPWQEPAAMQARLRCGGAKKVITVEINSRIPLGTSQQTRKVWRA